MKNGLMKQTGLCGTIPRRIPGLVVCLAMGMTCVAQTTSPIDLTGHPSKI